MGCERYVLTTLCDLPKRGAKLLWEFTGIVLSWKFVTNLFIE